MWVVLAASSLTMMSLWPAFDGNTFYLTGTNAQARMSVTRLPWRLVTSCSTLPWPIVFLKRNVFAIHKSRLIDCVVTAMQKEHVACKKTADEPITTTVLVSSVPMHVIEAEPDVVVMLMTHTQVYKSRTIYVGKHASSSSCLLIAERRIFTPSGTISSLHT